MKVVLNATGYVPNMDLLLHHRPTPLLHVCDRPILFHIIETLTHRQLDTFDLILYHLPEMIEERLGEGKRWGISLSYHLTKDSQNPLTTLSSAAQDWEEGLILFGQGDILPRFPEQTIFNSSIDQPVGFYFPNGEWSGWAIITTSMFKKLPVGASIEQLFKKKGTSYRYVEVERFLSGRSFQELHDSNMHALQDSDTSLLFPSTASLVEPGVWISRGVSLHSDATIAPPVFIGAHTHIHDKAVIGPNTVIERNCVIDKNSTLKDSVVYQQSYVGEGLTLNQTIVDRNLLINVALDTNVLVKDDFILDELSTVPITWYIGYFIERILASFIFVLNIPFYIALRLIYDVETIEMLHLPTPTHREGWVTFKWYYVKQYSKENRPFFLRFSKNIPNLLNIIKGHVHFVGCAPRTTKDIDRLPSDWKKLYIKTKVGLITLSDLENEENPSQEEVYTSEVHYASHMNWKYDFRLIGRWIWKKINNLFIYITDTFG